LKSVTRRRKNKQGCKNRQTSEDLEDHKQQVMLLEKELELRKQIKEMKEWELSFEANKQNL
jgi:hypothetical protein